MISHIQVTITFDLNNPLNGKYYKTTRTATISVKERNFDTNAVDLKITNTDGTMPSVSGWSISSQAGESDDAINTCRVEFSADGDYNMTMQCKDQAGNESNTVKVDEFTIDKTIPVISVSYDNNSAATSGYYNANRTATITIKEHNFNAAEVNSQITAALQEVVFPHRALEAGVTVEILIPQVLHSQMMEIIPLILTIQTLPEMQQQIIHRTVSLWIRQNRK